MSRFRAWKRSFDMAKLRNPCFFNRTRVADFFSSYSLRGDIIHWIHLRSVMTPLSPPNFLRQFQAQKKDHDRSFDARAFRISHALCEREGSERCVLGWLFSTRDET